MIAFLMAAAVLADAPPGPAPTAPSQFDLQCEGRVQVTNIVRSMAPEGDAPWGGTLHVDLKSGQWCEGKCEVNHKIARLDQDYLMLEFSLDHARAERKTWISRHTGAYYASVDLSPLTSAVTTGQCALLPFSGLAKTLF